MVKRYSGRRYLVADADKDRLIIRAVHNAFRNLVKTAASPDEAVSRIREVQIKHHTIDCILWDLALGIDSLQETRKYLNRDSNPEVYIGGSRVLEPEYKPKLESMKQAGIIKDYLEDKSLYIHLLQARIAATQPLPKKKY